MTHKYTFEWNNGNESASDNMKRLFKEKGIRYGYDERFRFCACIGINNAFVPVEYYHIANNLFGVTQRPQRTTEYFRMLPEELCADTSDGWIKEDCLICNKNPDALPFCDTLLDALEKADYYVANGYEDVYILERYNGKYGVVAY